MECTVHWMPASGMAFAAETGSGHLLTMDGAPDGGGRNLAPRPMETLLSGAGACTAYDVVLILKRGRHDVRGCSVQLHADRAEQDPKVFTRLRMHFIVTGQGSDCHAAPLMTPSDSRRNHSWTLRLRLSPRFTLPGMIVPLALSPASLDYSAPTDRCRCI